MDFTRTEEQVALGDLARQIFESSSPTERVTEIERTDERVDRPLWASLAQSNLLGVAIGEQHGGLGFGLLELTQVLEQQGRTVAPVPLLSTLVLGALPIAEFGSADLQDRWLPGVADGSILLTAALSEVAPGELGVPSVTARADGDGWLLDGSRIDVPHAHVADAIIVPASTGPDAVTLFVVPTDAAGVSVAPYETTSRQIHADLTLAATPVSADAVLGTPDGGRGERRWIFERYAVASSAVVLGCCEAATELMATYVSGREQFGRPLSTNQGVALRAADCYIDTECIRVTMLNAGWRLDQGLPGVDEVRVAKWWAAEGGQRLVHNVQHLHGGMGADVDYPVHRYFLWVKQLENTLGGGSAQLAALGTSIASAAKTAAGL